MSERESEKKDGRMEGWTGMIIYISQDGAEDVKIKHDDTPRHIQSSF